VNTAINHHTAGVQIPSPPLGERVRVRVQHPDDFKSFTFSLNSSPLTLTLSPQKGRRNKTVLPHANVCINQNVSHASILIGLLWCVALLSLIVVGVLHTAQMDLLTGKNFADKIQARYLALAGIEKAEALLYKNAQNRSHSGKNHTGEFYNDAADFREISFGRGTYSVLRRGRDDEGGGVIYGVSDEESRLNVNTANNTTLTKIQGLGPDVATAIRGWRGQGTAAEKDYYMTLQPPYSPRNGPFPTIREMLMVRGVTPDLLFGKDVHGDGLLEDLSDNPKDAAKYQDGVTTADLGWAALLTANSGVKNVNAAGTDRVDIQSADETALANVNGISRDIAHAIVAYRGKNRFSGIADLLDVTPPQNNNGGGQSGQNNFNQQGNSGGNGGGVIDENLLMRIGDDITVGSDKTVNGPVNINTAGLDVLICLPGIDRDLAQKIISHRASSGFFANTAELLKVDGMTRDIFKNLALLVTTRSETYRILAEGRVKSTGARQRIQVVVRVNLDGVKTLEYREDDL
jgi:DNA uptake protein ComE-like DNA-binding protein